MSSNERRIVNNIDYKSSVQSKSRNSYNGMITITNKVIRANTFGSRCKRKVLDVRGTGSARVTTMTRPVTPDTLLDNYVKLDIGGVANLFLTLLIYDAA